VTPRQAALLLALALALAAGSVSLRAVPGERAARRACGAALAGRADEALALTESRVGADRAGRIAAECRCVALLARGDGPGCAALLEGVLAQPAAADWVPRADLAIHLIQSWRDAGRGTQAAALAARAARAAPRDPDLFYLELVTRAALEPDEGALLRELALRIPARGPAAARMRTSLATRHLQRGDPAGALAALGERPPRGAGDASRWWETRAMALGSARDGAGLQAHFAAWERAGASRDELLARYAVTLSITALRDPRSATGELLERAFGLRERLEPGLAEQVAVRLVLSLVNQGRAAEALARYDEARPQLALAGISREELLRSAAARERRLGRAPAAETARFEFRVRGAAAGAQLWLAPPPAAGADASYTAHPLAAEGGALALGLERAAEESPLRWVLRDAAGARLASGSAAGGDAPLAIAAGAAQPPAAPQRLLRRSGDGRRRIALVLLDCGDWRLLEYLRARGELPVFAALFAAGHRAVLRSDPPMTAAALEALVWPGRPRTPSFTAWLHQLGSELAGLESIGRNPLAPLRWFLPASRDLFATLGAGPLRVANLLFSHGGIDAGRHASATGPHGETSELPLARASRDLRPEERERFPLLAAGAAASERDAVHLRSIAAELDAARELARDPALDFFALRVEPLDLLTHARFSEIARARQDDGASLLFELYRYLDARLGELDAALDSDDILVVMSDHGIQSAMEHSRDALFVAVGGDLPAGRADGQPELAGVPFLLAEWLGVEVQWPDTGIGPRRASRAAR